MGSSTFLASTSALLFLAAHASASLCGGFQSLGKCVFPTGYPAFAAYKEAAVDTLFKEGCANGQKCVETFISTCMDAESTAYYHEVANASVSRVMKDVCQDGPLHSDVMKHRACWKQDKVEAAVLQCKKNHRFASQIAKIFVDRNTNMFGDENNVGQCVGWTLFFMCHLDLLNECDVKSKQCVTGYVNSMYSNQV